MDPKRPFDEEAIQELISLKRAKQLDDKKKPIDERKGKNKITSTPEAIPDDIFTQETSERTALSGELEYIHKKIVIENIREVHTLTSARKSTRQHETHGCRRITKFGNDKAEKEAKTSAASWITRNRNEEEDGRGGARFSSVYPNSFGSNSRRRADAECEDEVIRRMNSFPRKRVPIGPNHQADVPEWDPIAARKYSLSSKS